MKNIVSKKNSTKIRKHIALCLVIFMASFYHTIQACESFIITADMLTKLSYTSSEMQKTVLLFTNNTLADAAQNLPSVQEIITKVCQLQNQQGFIKSNKIRKQAIDALQAAIKATDNALSLTNLQQQSKDFELYAPFIIDDKLIDLLKNQKIILQKKVGELTKKSMWQYVTKPSMTHALIALAITTALITGITLYFDLFDLDISQHSQEPIIFTAGPFEEKREALYTKMRTILMQFIDPNDKQHTTAYLTQAKNILKELDPVQDHSVIEMINTFIESQSKMDAGACGFFNKEIFENARYLEANFRKKPYYTKILVEILNHDSNKTKIFTPENIDLMNILSQKNKYPRTT